MIRSTLSGDIREICSIYNYYIENTTVTFEDEPVSADEMEKRILEVATSYPWLVYEDFGKVIGYAYASRWKARAAYKHSAELSVYVSKDYLGKGIGKKLYEALIAELRKTNIHVVIGGMSLPNEQSKRLHESMEFRKVAEFKEVGNKFQKWIDVGYWELIL
jgi:L-amino acid N-acyltransferase YncA